MRLFFSVTVATALLGCAANRLSNEVKSYVGRDIHELVARLGKPTGQQETPGTRIYVWSVTSEGVLPAGPGSDSNTTRIITVQHDCTLEVTVSAGDVIQSYEVEGSDAGCAAFRRNFNR